MATRRNNLEKRFDLLKERLAHPDFLNIKSQGGELAFYIFDYDPEDELKVRDLSPKLEKQLQEKGIQTLTIDLFETIVEILENFKIGGKSALEKTLEIEERNGKARVESTLKSFLTPHRFVEIIEKKSEGKEVVFLVGVGKVWPVIRSHTILNNLHSVLDHLPVVMFFPGTYDQLELSLFNEFKDDNYYRAFKLVEDTP